MTTPDKQEPEEPPALPPPPFGQGGKPPAQTPDDPPPEETGPPPPAPAAPQLPPPPSRPTGNEGFKPPVPVVGSLPPGGPGRPSECQTLGVLTIVGGCTAMLFGLGVMFMMCCYPIYLLQIPVGIWGLVHGAKMLGAEEAAPKQVLAILYMVCLLGCDPITFSMGLVILIMMSKAEVRNYYLAQGKVY